MADAFGVMSYLQIQSMFESFFPPGRLVYIKSNFIRSMNDETVDALVPWVGKSPSFALHVCPVHRTLARSGNPGAHRRHGFSASAIFVEYARLVDVGEPG